jgi:sec-independent protein translocase protein TatA
MPNIGTGEIVLLLLLALLLFGAKRLPEIGRSMGRGLREFKDSVTGKDDRDDEVPELPVATTTDASVNDASITRNRERDPV